ncbi:hypothetical protein IE985_30325 [Klebsiella pneumoniae]|nr:hypothetical protein [Klebsiella pneumoniae]
MPRRSILSAAERSLLALPDTKDELIRHYTFSEATSPSGTVANSRW